MPRASCQADQTPLVPAKSQPEAVGSHRRVFVILPFFSQIVYRQGSLLEKRLAAISRAL